MTSESGATVYEPAVDNTDTGQDGLTEGRNGDDVQGESRAKRSDPDDHGIMNSEDKLSGDIAKAPGRTMTTLRSGMTANTSAHTHLHFYLHTHLFYTIQLSLVLTLIRAERLITLILMMAMEFT